MIFSNAELVARNSSALLLEPLLEGLRGNSLYVAISQLAFNVYFYLFLSPLATLWRYGPTLWGYGFWGGKEAVDICAELTTVPAAHWCEHSAECATLLGKNFQAFAVLAQSLAYMYCLYKALSLLTRLFYYRCLVRFTGRLTPPANWRLSPPANWRLSPKKEK